MQRRIMRYGGALLFAGVLALTGCSGEDGDPGPQGPEGPTGPTGPAGEDLTATAKPESCAVCHGGAGAAHQAIYDRYTDTSTLEIEINGIESVANGTTPETYTSTMTVTITKNGLPYVAGIPAMPQGSRGPIATFYATKFNSTTGKFDTTVNYPATSAAPATSTTGVYTVTATQEQTASVATALSFKPEDGPSIAFAYVVDTEMSFEAFPVYDNVAHDGMEFPIGTGITYTSAANDSACQKCHGTPYRKHGYRVAATPDLEEFAACKVCHYDTRVGGHQDWQLLVDDPLAYATASTTTTPTRAELLAKYPYTASVMNDTHMSHAMEFAYPQSMANCVTCHEGKLDRALADANFTLATCKSCHPVTGVGGTDPKRAPPLSGTSGVVPHSYNLYTSTVDCSSCHVTGNGMNAPTFAEIHSGYNKLIYANVSGTLTKYSSAFTAAISNASVTNNVLAFTVTVTESTDIAGLDADDVVPTAYIAPYGYGTKDFLLAAKSQKLAGVTPAAGWTVTPGTPTATSMSWDVTADLAVVGGAGWTDRIAATGSSIANTINRVELAVLPFLPNLDGFTYIPHGATTPATAPVALNAVTKTFDLDKNAFAAAVTPIVDVNKCNACHDALGTTFHTADRGGSAVACRVCHNTINAGSHLEMQSRSIDSYVHAIHSMQPFDIGEVDFADPVEALHYEHHVESTYPNFSILNCESCHNPGKYEVPDQSKSLPGLHSGSDALTNGDRAIGALPKFVTGPASRACGSCHRARMINHDDAGGLAAFDSHAAANGYVLDATVDDTATVGNDVLNAAIEKIMSLFK